MIQHLHSRRLTTLGLLLLLAAPLTMSIAKATDVAKERTGIQPATPADPSAVVSPDACVKCHAAEVEVWRQTPHALAFTDLHRRPEAKAIAKNLGIRSIKYDDRCVACHYTQKIEGGNTNVIAGISCESCHGAAAKWLDIHHDYGGPTITKATETPEHRSNRVDESIAAGMRNPSNAYLLAQSCFRCHTVQDEQLVNSGGHSLGSLDFELVSWSQGKIHHNFLTGGGVSNLPSSPERRRILFVAGLIADLEACLRATAKATVVDTYGLNAAKRAARAAVRLESVAQKTRFPVVHQIVELYHGLELSVGQADMLNRAADNIASLGMQFADSTTPEQLLPLEDYIPLTSQWK